MYEISCDMCQDLIPLVEDGVASADSREAVAAHLASCSHCGKEKLPEPPPAADEKKTLDKLGRMLTLSAVGFVALGVVWGFAFIAWFFPAMSVIVALAGVVVFLLFRRALRKGWGSKVLALVCAAGLLLLIDTLCGNPVSQLRAEQGTRAYLQENYPDLDLQVERVTFNFLQGEYYAVITSPTSIDSHFELDLNRSGEVTWDGYRSHVASGMNTRGRLLREYRELVDPILKKLNLETGTHGAYGELVLNSDEMVLEIDGKYDVAALGNQYGHLHVTVRDEDVTPERATELLLRVEELMVEHGGGYATVELSVWSIESGGIQLNLEPLDRAVVQQEGLLELVRAMSVITGQGGAELN